MANNTTTSALTAQIEKMEAERDMISVPRGLLGCAISAIDKKRDAPRTLDLLRHYAYSRAGESNNAQPVTERNTFLPVADLFSITAPDGISISYTADARHASDSRASGFAVHEYVRIERYQGALCAPTAAPVVLGEMTREEHKRRFKEEDEFDDTFRGGWNACRAAMLKSPHTAQAAPALESDTKTGESLRTVARAALDYIDALPADVAAALPAMPGFDRDWAETVLSGRQAAQDNWIPCSERMPDAGFDVLVTRELDAPECWMKKIGYIMPGTGRWCIYGVDWVPTHWMPLPAAPAQEDGQ